MANKLFFSVLAILLGFALTEGCRPGRFPRPRPRPPSIPPGSGDENQESRFLTNLSPQMMYLGSADEKAFYAAVNLPMDYGTALDYCESSNMELASSIQTENQKELLASAINEVAYAFGLDDQNSPIRYWTSSFETDEYAEEMITFEEDECETASVYGTDVTTGLETCSHTVEITICEADD